MWNRLFQYKDIGKNTEQRGEEVVKIMNAISLFYPFPAKVKIINGNSIKTIEKQQPILFNNLEMVEKWINDTWRDATIILGMSYTYDLEKILIDYSRKWNNESGIKEIEMLKIDFAKAFIPSFMKAREIAGATIPYLSQYKSYKRRLPSKWLIILWLLLAAIAFISGVFIPMYNISNCKLCLIWIPLSFYGTTFLIIFYKIYIS